MTNNYLKNRLTINVKLDYYSIVKSLDQIYIDENGLGVYISFQYGEDDCLRLSNRINSIYKLFIDLGAEWVTYNLDTEYDESHRLLFRGYRHETEEEFNTRINEEKQKLKEFRKKEKAKRDEKELKAYLRLKKKFEKNAGE